MTALVLGISVVVAAAAAVRSTWSPCGLSMLSTITPLTERARGHRFAATASWFVLGAVLGGATLGLLTAGVAALVASLSLSTTATLAVAAVLALLSGAIDAGVLGVRPPFFKRQVNDDWLRQYRPWAYGMGFGWQIGAGVTTYIMTTGVLLAVALAALTGTPAAAFAVCVGFGLVRGLAVLLGKQATDPASMRTLHARFDAWEVPVRTAVTAVQVVAAIVLVGAVTPTAGLVLAVAVGAVAVLARPRLRAHADAAVGIDG